MMPFKNGYSLAIKSDGEFLREKNVNGERQAFLKFDSEYSIFIKNKTTYRSSAMIYIDGKLIHPKDNSFVINPNSSLEVERFLIDGDLNKGEKFKFVNVDDSDEEPGACSNGIIEVRIRQESRGAILKQLKELVEQKSKNWNKSVSDEWYFKALDDSGGNLSRAADIVFGESATQTNNNTVTGIYCTSSWSDSVNNINYSYSINNTVLEEGVTVGGAESNQKFSTVESFELSEQEIILKIRLKPIRDNSDKGACPGCNGEKVQTDNRGIKVICPVCNGTGRF